MKTKWTTLALDLFFRDDVDENVFVTILPGEIWIGKGGKKIFPPCHELPRNAFPVSEVSISSGHK